MKKLIFLWFVGVLLAAGCRKDDASYEETPEPSGSLLFEDDNIRVDLISASIPYLTLDIFFFNAYTGLAATFFGEIYKTTDGGASWTLHYSDSAFDGRLGEILFTDMSTGFAVGGSTSCVIGGCVPYGGLILKTTDGGNSWTQAFRFPAVEFGSISANNDGHLFAHSHNTAGQIFKSTDGGLSWTLVDIFNPTSGAIAFNNNFGYIGGAFGAIVQSDDNGMTWTNITTLPDGNFVSDIKFTNGIGYCISGGGIFKTTDNGANWALTSIQDGTARIINPLTTNSCVAFGIGGFPNCDFCSPFGGLTQTIDAGATWTKTELPDIGIFRATSFYSTLKGYATDGTHLIRVSVKKL